jgi:ATP-dependent RNA helicase DDX5/DBP2
VLDIGQSEDLLALQIAMLPCLIGYGRIARRLYEDPETVTHGQYWKWVETYVAADYCEAMAVGSSKIGHVVKTARLGVDIAAGMIEEAASKQSVSRIDELAKIFIHATKVR